MDARNFKPLFLPSVTLLALATALPVSASVVNIVPLNIDAHVVTFSSYDLNTTTTTLVSDSLSTGIDVGTADAGEVVRLTSNDAEVGRILGALASNFDSNGTWPTQGAYAGLNDNSGSLRFTFERGMDFVGGLFNYRVPNDSTTKLEVRDINGDAIETLILSSNPVGLGQFLGFTSASAGIYSLTMSGNFIAVDNLTFGTARTGNDVPEPGVLSLALASLGLLAFTRKRTAPRRG